MLNRTWIRDAKILRHGQLVAAHVLVEGRKIAQVQSSELPEALGANILDAGGKWLLPLAIDVHVHGRDPGDGLAEDAGSLSRAALAGGVGTVCDMPNNDPPTDSVERLAEKRARFDRFAAIRVGLYALVHGGNLEQIPAMAAQGIVGFKIYMGPSTGDVPPLSAEQFQAALAAIATSAQPRLVVHAEDASLLTQARANVQGEDSFDAWCRSRPPEAEQRAVAFALHGLARTPGLKLHIAHVSTTGSVEQIRCAKRAGLDVSAETCPQYLFLDAKEAERTGASAKINPPIREQVDQQALWSGLHDGTLDLVASDHAPHAPGHKSRASWWQIPSGAIGVQTMVPLLLDAHLRGKLSLAEVLHLTVEAPIRRFRLPSAAEVAAGADADLMLFDPQGTWEISEDSLFSKAKNCPYLGWRLQGYIEWSMLHGTVHRGGVPAS